MDVVSPAVATQPKLLRRARRAAPEQLAAKDLRLRTFLRAMRAESFALTALAVYLLFEYLRPQHMFPIIDVIPWGMTTIVTCTVAAFMARGSTGGLNYLDALCVLFLMVVFLSMITAYSPSEAFLQWLTPVSHAMMFFSVRAILSSPNRLLLFSLCFALINLKYSQYSTRAFLAGGGGASGSGWFNNTGELGMQMGIAFFVSLCLVLALRPYVLPRWRWWAAFILFPGTAFIAVLGSGSRASQLGVAFAAVLMLMKPPQLLRKILMLVVLVGAVSVLLPESQKERFRSVGDDGTSQSRMAYWDIGRDIIDNNPLGVGYANWSAYYGQFYWNPGVFSRIEVSHNSYIDVFVELGYHGGALFLLLLASAFAMNLKTQARLKHKTDASSAITRSVARGTNLALLSMCIAAFFMSVLYYPVFWLAFAMTSAAYQISSGITRSAKRSGSGVRRVTRGSAREAEIMPAYSV